MIYYIRSISLTFFFFYFFLIHRFKKQKDNLIFERPNNENYYVILVLNLLKVNNFGTECRKFIQLHNLLNVLNTLIKLTILTKPNVILNKNIINMFNQSFTIQYMFLTQNLM